MKLTPQQIADGKRIELLATLGSRVQMALRILRLDMGTTKAYYTAIDGIKTIAKKLKLPTKGPANADTDASTTRPGDSTPPPTTRTRSTRRTERKKL